MNTNEDVKKTRKKEQLPSVSSEASNDTNDDEKASATFKNKQHVKEIGGKTKISTFVKVPYQNQP